MGVELPVLAPPTGSVIPVASPPQPPIDQPPSGQVAPPPVAVGELPYSPQPILAGTLLAAAVAVIFGTGLWYLYSKSWNPPGYTGGGAAATVGILVALALVLRYPTLIMDDTPDAGGEPSTMRIMSLAIVLTFCLIALRTGWNSGTLPSIDGNWVWLVTAALGGKALQKFAEIQDKK